MKKIIIVCTLIAIMQSSCNKILDTKPLDFIAPENYYNNKQQLESALAGVYDRLGDLRVYGRGMATFMVFSDEFFMKNGVSGMTANIIDAATLEINRHWEALYTGIERANMLMENMWKAGVEQDVYNEIRGQALFLRAYYYFMLVDQYGGVPLKLTYTNTPEDLSLPKSSVAEVYEQITKDMKEAATLVKPISAYSYNTRITKTFVQGVLARVYLTMAGAPLKDVSKYNDARIYADSVIQSGLHDLNPDFAQIFINHVEDIYDTKECLWEVDFKGQNQGEIQEGGTIGIYNGIACANIEVGFGHDVVHATRKLYNAYATADLRKDWSVAPFRYTASGTTAVKTNWTATQIYERSIGKWRREYEKNLPRIRDYNATNWPILRYSDVLLMYAEADNFINNGPSASAYNALNKVRRRGYGKNITVADVAVDAPVNMSHQDFHEYIMNERLRELSFEGLRKHDLVRWGIYVTTMQNQAKLYASDMPTALRDAAIIQATQVTERAVVFPIPNSEVATNTKITQNPGW